MRSIFKTLRRLTAGSRAATAVEYGLIAALIVVACVGGMTTLGGGLQGQWNRVNNSM